MNTQTLAETVGTFLELFLTSSLQWSSRGNDVHLVDGQETQLKASLKAIDGFQKESGKKGTQWGRIITHSPTTLREALKTAWLVVEVRQQSER